MIDKSCVCKMLRRKFNALVVEHCYFVAADEWVAVVVVLECCYWLQAAVVVALECCYWLQVAAVMVNCWQWVVGPDCY